MYLASSLQCTTFIFFQDQFNVFVLGLRTQYKDKVVTFRQVIEVHRKELDSHKSYWEQTLMVRSWTNSPSPTMYIQYKGL